ncbi:MAG: Maf family protein [Desulfovibrio sp.]|nr:Maf family protein [Desulfovibrio sp.]
MSPLFWPEKGVVIYLASASPRRRQMLASLGLPYVPLLPVVDEPVAEPGENPDSFVCRSAKSKGLDCLSRYPEARDGVIIAADTIVCLEKMILGKPRDEKNALEILNFLNGKSHFVDTGVYCAYPGGETSFATRSVVKFARWPESVLAAYAASGEPLDKAGGYAIQENGAFLIEGIMGSWTNVVGLPLDELVEFLLLKKFIAPAGAIA